MTFRAARYLILLAVIPAHSFAVADDKGQSKPKSKAAKPLIVFGAMGDVPYAPKEDVLLPKQVASLPAAMKFVIHVGDIKSGATACDEAVYIKVSGMLSKAAMPVFIIPGDNEWNDCKDPASAWKFWHSYFMRFDQRWKHQFGVFRQLEREENFSFVENGVLFLGINVVGGRVHDPAEWKTRLAQTLDWTKRNLHQFGESVSSVVIFGHAKPNQNHRVYFDGLSAEATTFKKPILYLHGDGHRWIHDRPFAAKNILRVQVDQGGIAPPLLVTITDDATEPFRFDRRKPEPEK